MTKFAGKSFSVAVGSSSYRENFDRIFNVDRTKPPTGYAIRMVETGGAASFIWFTADAEGERTHALRQDAIADAWKHYDRED